MAIAVVASRIDPSAADARIMAEPISLHFFFLLVRLFQLHCKENPETQWSAPLSFSFFLTFCYLLLSNAVLFHRLKMSLSDYDLFSI